jgi:hypothetical protein
MHVMPNRALDRVLDANYLAGLDSWPIDEVRIRRGEAQVLEDAASFLRRLLQGRLDIIGSEIAARAAGVQADLIGIVEQLPQILSDHGSPYVGGRLMSDDVGEAQVNWALAKADEAFGEADIGDVPELPEAELMAIADRLADLENHVSAERRTLHDVIDRLQAELVRRYRSGEASVESLLRS